MKASDLFRTTMAELTHRLKVMNRGKGPTMPPLSIHGLLSAEIRKFWGDMSSGI